MQDQIQKIIAWLGTGSINIFGLPFCGKDTQGRKLADLFGGVLISGGDILRSHHDQAKIDQIMSAGELIPSDLFADITLPYLSRLDFKNKPLILSSIGRLEGEETIIFEAARSSGHPTKAVIFLTIPEESVWQRFETAKALHDRGERHDDTREALKTRLHEFETKTRPVIEFYRSKNLLLEIDGTPNREQVTGDILTSLERFASRS